MPALVDAYLYLSRLFLGTVMRKIAVDEERIRIVEKAKKRLT
jgi:hypothetical protein